MPTVETHITAADLHAALRHDVEQGLTTRPRTLPPKWLYDERGSALFEQITRLPEYYPTRTERAILASAAVDIAGLARADTLVELGAGSGEKTRLLLDGMRDTGLLRRFVPVDVSGDFLEEAAGKIGLDYPGLAVHAVIADFDRHVEQLPVDGRRMVAMLGSTIGNQTPGQRHDFLSGLRATLKSQDSLLLGVDLVKGIDRLLAAYDDPAGVTASFNRNVLRVINNELGADFHPGRFGHIARWDAEHEWMEMRLRSDEQQLVHIPDLGLTIEFDRGEEMRTEISAKFRIDGVRAELAECGLPVTRVWTDPEKDYAVLLARPS
ncbi:L-histidine N(alpha)-methyltransferase [Nocardiopsis ansamitocini]|uniref:Histidine N-alpha-methyltransferase n=1 Tax=Nocardiopsis ansamitocini TaxID=1670832 RepID=A0A9W6P6A6_9ACTN|nr:L-histidine N(alpha)-methyltransferase [Nocardiopsis ansamitocini]GLU47862.1 histidine N-alpha-methyltransferase [Nocardiopsis ansamitocini]